MRRLVVVCVLVVALALACGICFVIAAIVGIGVAVIGYMIESAEVAPSIFPLRIAVPIVSSLFIAAAIILVKRWRGTHLCSTSGKDNPVPM